jgi:hypothetical protein
MSHKMGITVQKKLSFKDFLTVDYTPGMPEQISWNAKKRKRSIDTSESFVPEALSLAGRMKRRTAIRKNKAKLAAGRRRASRRVADEGRLLKRARKAVITLLYRKFAKGVSRDKLPPSRKQEIEKRLERMKPRIEKIARRLLPRIRQMDRARRNPNDAGENKGNQGSASTAV